MVATGRRQTLLTNGGVERLNLMARDLIEFLITEGLSKTQPEQLLILLGGALPGSDIRKIILLHERGIRRGGPFVLLVLAWITARGDFRLQLQRLLFGVRQTDVVGSTDLDVLRASRAFIS